jgi:o-succinylbenzoate---CoA ligase
MEYKIPEIVVNGQSYLVEEILQGFYDTGNVDPFTHEILDYCREWYSHKDSFSISTSGSTGDPRPIEISRQQMMASAEQTNNYFNLKQGDRLLLCLNPKFIGGKMMLVRAFVGNMKIIAVEPVSNPLESVKKSDRFEFMAISPHQLYNMLSHSEDKLEVLQQMKAVIAGGAPVDPSLKEMAQKLSVPVYSTYGMTETVSHVALQKINGKDAVDYFEGIGDVEFGADERGCLTVIGRVTDNQLVITNDLVELLSSKRFRWRGRVDNVINSGGIKTRTEELERKITQTMAENNLYCRFFVFPLPDRVLGQKICMAIDKSCGVDKEKLMDILNPSLDKFEKPKEIYCLDRFIETPSGKIDRKKSIELID